MFFLKKLLSTLMLPPLMPLLLVALGLLLLGRRPRLGKSLAWLGFLAALFFSTPWTVGLLLTPLEDMPVLSPEAARGAQAVVILGAGKNHHAPEYGGESVNRLGLERVRYGARLARQYSLPILVTGGILEGKHSEAALMKEALETDFRLPVRWVEGASRDTRENARESARLLRSDGIRRVILVSHAAHLKRAAEEFRAVGLEVTLAPTGYLGGVRDDEWKVGDFLPSPAGAYAGWYASHEWLGLFARKLGL